MQARDGHLYGTAVVDPFGGGRIFRMTLAGDASTLHEFPDGSAPIGQLLDASDGGLYGTTFGRKDGASNESGTVFRLDAAGTVTTVHRFSGPDGANPVAGLLQATDGALYGTTVLGVPAVRASCSASYPEHEGRRREVGIGEGAMKI